MIGTSSARQNSDEAYNNWAKFIIPPFVQYEIQRGLLIKPNNKHEQAYNRLIESCELGEMTAVAWKKAAEVYVDWVQLLFMCAFKYFIRYFSGIYKRNRLNKRRKLFHLLASGLSEISNRCKEI